MGFDLSTNTVLLDFTGTRYAGAHVRARIDMPYSDVMAFNECPDLLAEWAWFRDNALVEWDLQIKGADVPIGADVNDLPRTFVRQLIRGWSAAVLGLADPLDETSV